MGHRGAFTIGQELKTTGNPTLNTKKINASVNAPIRYVRKTFVMAFYIQRLVQTFKPGRSDDLYHRPGPPWV